MINGEKNRPCDMTCESLFKELADAAESQGGDYAFVQPWKLKGWRIDSEDHFEDERGKNHGPCGDTSQESSSFQGASILMARLG